MYRYSKLGAFIIWALVLFTASAMPGQPEKGASAATSSRVQERVLESAALNSEIVFHIYVPEAYDSEPQRRFPVVYWLHGSGASSQAASGAISRLFDSAIRAGKIPAMLLVFPDGLGQSMWVDSKDGRIPMEAFVVRELVPHIDASFRTIPSAQGRIVEGGSMGGYGAARLGFKYPKDFGAVSMLAAGPLQEALDPQDAPVVGAANAQAVLDRVYGGDAEYFRALSPWVLVENNAPELRGKVVRLIVGEQDAVLDQNRRFSEHMTRLGIRHTFEVLPGVGHSPRAFFPALGKSDRYWEFFRKFFEDLNGN